MQQDVSQVVAQPVQAPPREITLSTGVVLRGKQAPPLILVRIMGRFPRPQVPVMYNSVMGREMENPTDPDYVERVKAWEVQMSEAVLNALILFGTEVVSVPEGFPGPEDNAWLEKFRLVGLPMEETNPSWRYLNWIVSTAAADEKDTKKIQEVVGRLSGVPETSVQAAEHFPGSDQEH